MKNKNKYKNKLNIEICDYCQLPSNTKKVVRCASPNCLNKLCKGCGVIIDDKIFCQECIINMLNNDVDKLLFKVGTTKKWGLN